MKTFNKKRNLENILEKEMLSNKNYELNDINIYKNLAKQQNLPLHQILLNERIFSDTEIKSLVKEKLRYPYADHHKLTDIPENIISLIPREFIEKYTVLPFELNNGILHLVSSEPQNLIMIDQLKNDLNLELKLYFMINHEIKKYINYIFADNDLDNIMKEINLEEIDLEENTYDNSITLEADETSTIKLVNGILNEAIKSKASDVHIEPMENFIRVRLRVDGELRVIMDHINKKFQNSIISRLKIISDLIIVETRRPQGGRFTIGKKGEKIYARSSFIPTQYGEKCVLRLDDASLDITSFKNLGFEQNEILTINKVLQQPNGVILIVGPTGSGKTTTLYSMLHHVNQIEKNVVTVEDPIERKLSGILQSEIDHKIGLGFPEMLKEFLRQDPDIIMIGEMRDLETAQTCMSAAATGHLVLSTLHSNDTIGTINRLEDMGVENYKLAGNINLIISQVLIRKPCPHCSTIEPISEIDLQYLKGIADKFEYKLPEDIKVTITHGCPKCFNTGYSGRFGIFEVLEPDNVLKEKILQKANRREMYDVAKSDKNFKRIQVNLIESVLNNKTTLNELKTKVNNNN